jgi:hypothetical protein
MIKTTIYSEKKESIENFFENEDLSDAYVLDQLRGNISFEKKCFAIIEDKNKIQIGIIKNNCLYKINLDKIS